jgi:hypothetical protein
MEECPVCIETFTKMSHKKVRCCFCSYEACHRCIQKYILGEIQDPHCMKCKKIWTREFIDESLPKQFINNELKTHREIILFEKEKNLLPETQDNVRLLKQQEEMEAEMKRIETDIISLQRRYDDIERRKNEINPYKLLPSKNLRLRITRIPCSVMNCRGFAEENDRGIMICGICQVKICTRCREQLEENHECKSETVQTIELLEKDTKRCPCCMVQIFKIHGCDQMWCVSCHNAFDWKTGEKVKGIIHNPHYHEYIETHGLTHTRLEESYHRFQFLDTDLIVNTLQEQGCPELTIYQIIEVYRYVIHYYEIDLQRLPSRFDQTVNVDLRIHFLTNQLSEDDFKIKLQRRQKDTEKKIEYRDIGETYVEIMNDVFISFVEQKNIDKLVYEIQTVTKSTQEAIVTLNKRYNSSMPLVRTFL